MCDHAAPGRDEAEAEALNKLRSSIDQYEDELREDAEKEAKESKEETAK